MKNKAGKTLSMPSDEQLAKIISDIRPAIKYQAEADPFAALELLNTAEMDRFYAEVQS